MRRIVPLLLAVLAAQPSAAWARKPRPTPCPGARYVVRDLPLLGSPSGPGPDLVVFDPTQLAVASGCAPAAVKRTASRRGTTLKATCASLRRSTRAATP